MKLFLFGGAETHDGHSNVAPLFKLMEQTIKKINPKQILHIPFARIVAKEPEWEGDYFHRNIHLEGVEYLNAANEGDIGKADSPLIFISGGGQDLHLLGTIQSDPRLEQLVRNAEFVIGESSGSKIWGSFLRAHDKHGEIVPGLGIIKDTIIEPHYIEKSRQALLVQEMKEMKLKYGIGIDAATGIAFDVEKFPKEYEVIGDGVVEVKVNSDLT